jgi:signal transduction histidine kinase
LLEEAIGIVEGDVKEVACGITVPENLYPVSIDFGQMLQAVGNILRNAKEASPEKGRIDITAENVDSYSGMKADSGDGEVTRSVRISIRDYGTGIDSDELPKIFDPYFSTKERCSQKGMGLGLSIAHSIIRKHYGDILVESRPGRGTTVKIVLPAEKESGHKQEV